MDRSYHRVLLGERSKYAKQCFDGNFIGTNYDVGQDLTGSLPEDWHDFNAKFRSVFLERNPGKSMIGAGLACGALWTVSKGVKVGDIVLCPDGAGKYHVGEVTGEYQYDPESVLVHQRPVRWLDTSFERSRMSEALKNGSGWPQTIVNLDKYSAEIEALISGVQVQTQIQPNSYEVQSPSSFALEKHLEDFMVANWSQTELGRDYNIYEEDGIRLGKQYPSDTGPMDILAVSKDNKRLLVVELKLGRPSDCVVGQVLRYMSYVKDEIAEPWQEVHGVVIGLEDDLRLKRALSMVPNLSFYRYEVNFKLFKGD